MIHEFFTNKWILGAVGFIILFAGVCYLWYQHDTAPYRQEAAETVNLIREWESPVNTQRKTKETADVTAIDKTLLSASESILNTKMKTADSNDTSVNPKGDTPINVTDEQVRVSPHGFGPYPEIPKGAPVNPFTGKERRSMELLMRVIIKKWNEGVRFKGATIERGKVYLNYPNTIYVQYGDPKVNPDGSITRPITSAGGSNDVFITEEQMRSGQIPADLRVSEYDKSGIDPYEYLNLPEKP